MSTNHRLSPAPLSPADAALDVAAVILAICAAWGVTRLFLYPALSIPQNAPAILRPISGFFVAWWLLHRRGLGWDSVGLRKPVPWWIVIAGAAVLYLANRGLGQYVAPVLAQWISPVQQASFMGYIRGNPPAFALWLTIGIVVGGFMEECLFRGFLLNRVAAMLGGSGAAIAVGIVAQAVLFGLLHLYGGVFACVFAGLAALASGVVYLLVKRNLWPLILAHAAWNTVALTSLYRS